MAILNNESATGQSGDTSTPTAGNSTTTAETTTTSNSPWYESMPDEIKNNETIRHFKDIPSLAKSYLHAQTLVGKKGVIPPTDKDASEVWDAFYKAIGRPELDKFEVKPPEGVELDEKRLSHFKQMTHSLGLLPRQAQGLLSEMAKAQKIEIEARTKAIQEEQTKQIEDLKKEWGEAFDKKTKMANAFIKKFGGDEFFDHISKAGIGDDVKFIKFLAKAGELLEEDTLRGGNGTGNGAMTPEELKAEHEKLSGQLVQMDSSNPAYKSLSLQVEALAKKRWAK